MIWIERFDGRWERAANLNEAMHEPVRAFGLTGRRAPRGGAGGSSRKAGLDPSGIRGIPAADLQRVLTGHRRRPGHACQLPHSKVERSLGLVQ